MLAGRERQIGRLAWVMAWFGLVIGQLHALSRFRTEDGACSWPITSAAQAITQANRPICRSRPSSIVFSHVCRGWVRRASGRDPTPVVNRDVGPISTPGLTTGPPPGT